MFSLKRKSSLVYVLIILNLLRLLKYPYSLTLSSFRVNFYLISHMVLLRLWSDYVNAITYFDFGCS